MLIKQLLLWLVMKSKLLDYKTLLSIKRIILLISSLFLEFQTFIFLTYYYTIFFFFQLDKQAGILAFSTGRQKIKMLLTKFISPWKNTLIITFTFIFFILSPTISFLLEGSFRYMFISLGQLLSRSTLVNLLLFRIILEQSFIKAQQMLLLQILISISITWLEEPSILFSFLVAHAICSSSIRISWLLIGILEKKIYLQYYYNCQYYLARNLG